MTSYLNGCPAGGVDREIPNTPYDEGISHIEPTLNRQVLPALETIRPDGVIIVGAPTGEEESRFMGI